MPESYYVDNFLCFGLSCAPSIFNRISCAIARTMQRRGFKIVNYLDDFLVIGETHGECLDAQQELLALLGSLGFSVNWEKVTGPCQRTKIPRSDH